ncbi:MAG: TorF family putative porin, partial [Pseudomonadota bacterium]
MTKTKSLEGASLHTAAAMARSAICVAAVSTAAWATPAMAQTGGLMEAVEAVEDAQEVDTFDTDIPSDFQLSGNIGVFSDYRFRGISLTDEDFALQGGVDLVHSSGFFVG